MIQINKEDNIYNILEKIKKEKKNSKKIILNFPIGHQVLYKKLALISIKESIGDKKLVIQTKDILSKKIGKKIGIQYHILNEYNKKNINLLKLNYNFFEYFLYEIKKIYYKFFNQQKFIDPRKKFLKFYKQKSNLKIFILLLILSISIFSYVFLFILNKTFVYLTPNIEVRNKSLNFMIKENSNGTNSILNALKIKKNLKIKQIINTSGIENSIRNRSKGMILFTNEINQDIRLLNHTRLQTNKGLLYEINESITIPKAKHNKAGTLIPGTIKTKIIAKTKDKNGNPIGTNGNIDKNIKFLIPGLEKKLQNKIYATSMEKFKGGKNNFDKIVSKDDIENGEKIFKEKLKKEAVKYIKKELNKINKEKNTKYKIPNINNIFTFSDLKIDVGDIKIGDKIQKFEIFGEITITSYAYDTNKVISKLKNEIEEHILKGKEKLINIDEKTLSSINKVGIISRSKNPFSITLSLGIDYYVEYDFLDQKDNYIKRLKQTISGLSKEKAEKILINEKKISNAKIKIRPFFINNVSKYFNNIEFIIEK